MAKKILISLLAPCLLLACEAPVKKATADTNSVAPKIVTIPKTTLEKNNGHYQILRDGKPYFIRGGGGSVHLDVLAAAGGNSLRTWSTNDAQRILDEAQQRGLTVMLGLPLGIERHGFNYSDEAAVKAQKEKMRELVIKYKDSPALLTWGLGNELDLFYTNKKVWDAVEDLAKMVKELDPNHLVTVVVADVDADKIKTIMKQIPSIDYLSVNIYGGLATLPQKLDEMGYHGAYAVTEWGPTGHWQIAKTKWGVPIEQTSTEKAKSYLERYQAGIAGAPDLALGSYAFLWGQKQETTPTWYGLFLESGEATEVVDTLQYLWTGAWPQDRAPSIREFLIDGKNVTQNIYLKANKTYRVKLDATQPNNEAINIRWEILPEATELGAGGDFEHRPAAVEGLIVKSDDKGNMEFKSPAKAGAYRLFTYVTTNHKKAATANIPFYVN